VPKTWFKSPVPTQDLTGAFTFFFRSETFKGSGVSCSLITSACSIRINTNTGFTNVRKQNSPYATGRSISIYTQTHATLEHCTFTHLLSYENLGYLVLFQSKHSCFWCSLLSVSIGQHVSTRFISGSSSGLSFLCMWRLFYFLQCYI